MHTCEKRSDKQHIDLMKRKLCALIGLMPVMSSCKASDVTVGTDIKHRFRDIKGGVLVIDAVDGMGQENVDFINEAGDQLFRSSLVAKKNRAIMAFGGPSFFIPKTVRVRWRNGDNLYNFHEQRYEGGVIRGDYTIEVARRIPDEVLDSIRKNGGALRLKFRLKNDGVLFGWDIERPGGGISRFDMPGGDFLDTKY